MIILIKKFMEIFILFATFCYAFGTFFLAWRWAKIPEFVPKNTKNDLKIALIVVLRNEEKNILDLLNDIEKQTFDKQNLEIYLINDHSSDSSLQIISAFKAKTNLLIKIYDLETEFISPKKAGISWAVHQTSAELILCTDADCRLLPTWISTISSFYLQKNRPALISSPVTFCFSEHIFTNLQIVEFASLIGSAAVFLDLKKPNMCNGANLAFRRDAFLEVGGYLGFENIASGDDEFLMHKIFAKYPKKVLFLKSKQVIVKTQANFSLKQFLEQRKRWASKWKFYKNISTKILALLVFSYQILFIYALFLLFSNNAENIVIIFSHFLLKFIADFVFLAQILIFLGYSKNRFLIFPCQFLYPFYVIWVGISSQLGTFEWKGRKY
ncbi:MAG: glycosyltransferase [Bacteroidetes bacterium]|nr:MAG: glycosyltransferase [Bacteroidota bacterium]